MARGCRPVRKATDVNDPAAPQSQDLPALLRSACLASRRRASDLEPHQKRPGAGGHLADHRTCAGGSRAGPPGDNLVPVLAVGGAGTFRRAPAGVRIEQIPDGVEIAGFQSEPDPSGEPGRLASGAGIVRQEDLPRLRSWQFEIAAGQFQKYMRWAPEPGSRREAGRVPRRHPSCVAPAKARCRRTPGSRGRLRDRRPGCDAGRQMPPFGARENLSQLPRDLGHHTG